MRQTLNVMLVQHAEMINSEIQAAVDKFCTPENLQHVVDEQVGSMIKWAVKGEIEDYFRYGAGRKAVREAVLAALPKENES